MRLFITLLLVIAITGCSTVNMGLDAYNKGQYDIAAGYWNNAAIGGDAAAQNNLGLLWENGLGSTPRNLNEASAWYLKAAKQNLPIAMVNLARVQLQLGYRDVGVSWLQLAARWGQQDASTLLRSLGLEVPSEDLLAAKKVKEQKDTEALGMLIGLALIGAVAIESPEVVNSVSLLPANGTPNAIESSINGAFEGWEGKTIVKLTNGQIWQQSEYYYEYHYAYMPEVLIYVSGGAHKIKVNGLTRAVRVIQLK